MKALFPLIVLLAAPAVAQPAKPKVVLGDIRFQLYQEISGTLSPPVGPSFSFWNTGAGEGSAKEPASNYLISVPLRSTTGDAEGSEVPLTLTVRNAAGKMLASVTRTYHLVPYKDQTYVALWLSDSPCVGKITVTATYAKQVRRAVYSLDCGE